MRKLLTESRSREPFLRRSARQQRILERLADTPARRRRDQLGLSIIRCGNSRQAASKADAPKTPATSIDAERAIAIALASRITG
jgi:hypothetical protein